MEEITPEMNYSLYTTCFNATLGDFDIESAVRNYSKFADEIVVGTISPELMRDDTHDRLAAVAEEYPQVKVLVTDVDPYTEPRWDGRLKNAALQTCSNEYCIQCDMDERLGGGGWRKIPAYLKSGGARAFMVPVVNLYHSEAHYKDISKKWYFHEKSGLSRDVVNFAEREDGTVDTSKSDGTELVDENRNLVPSIDFNCCEEDLLGFMRIDALPFVVHYGHVSAERRARLNREFWAGAWSRLDGRPASDVGCSEDDLVGEKYFEHGLKLLDVPHDGI